MKTHLVKVALSFDDDHKGDVRWWIDMRLDVNPTVAVNVIYDTEVQQLPLPTHYQGHFVFVDSGNYEGYIAKVVEVHNMLESTFQSYEILCMSLPDGLGLSTFFLTSTAYVSLLDSGMEELVKKLMR